MMGVYRPRAGHVASSTGAVAESKLIAGLQGRLSRIDGGIRFPAVI